MKALRGLGGAALLLLASCQFTPTAGREQVVVHLPLAGLGRGAGGIIESSTTAFPPSLAADLDHYVISIEFGGVDVVPAKSVTMDATSVGFSDVPLGSYDLRVEAWTTSALVAAVVQPIVVAAGAPLTIQALVLEPVIDGAGLGSFDLLFPVDSSVGSLFSLDSTENRLSARITPVLYASDGSVSTLSTPLSPNVAHLTQPDAAHLRIQSADADGTLHPIPTGNYLVELQATSLDQSGSLQSLTTFLVQVFSGLTSELPAAVAAPTVGGGVVPALPSGLAFSRSPSGSPTLSWTAPANLAASYYQIGYSLTMDAAKPDQVPVLVDASNPSKLVLGSVLHPQGGNYSVQFAANVAPWNSTTPVRLFVRAVYGNFLATSWSILDVNTAMSASRGVHIVAFDGLRPGASYQLVRRDSTATENRAIHPFTTNADPDHQTLKFPELVLSPGERLFLQRTVNGISVEVREVLLDLLPPVDPSSFDPAQIYYLYGGRDNSALLLPYWFLRDSPIAVPTGFDATLAGATWVVSDALTAFGVVERKVLGPDDHWEIATSAFAGGTQSWISAFVPQSGALDLYRLRGGYEEDLNEDTIPDHTLYGPASAWVAVDQQPPVIAFTAPAVGATYDVSSPLNTVVIDVSYSDQDVATRSHTPQTLSLWILDQSTATVLSPTNFQAFAPLGNGQHRWTSDWTVVGDYTIWSALPAGTYIVRVAATDTSGNLSVLDHPITLIGGTP